MNRFRAEIDQPTAQVHRPPHLEQSLMHTSCRAGINYSLFAPLHYEQNYGYPLLVWLHGPGDDERQLQRIMPLISMRNYVAVALRGPLSDRDGSRGYGWSDSDSDQFSAEQGIFECLEVASDKFNIDRRRVFLAGYQSGGTMALRLGLKHPEKFAGLLSVGGPFPVGQSPLLHLNLARQLPLLIAHGRDSQTYPIERTCEELRLFHAAGMHVTLRQYPCADELNPQMLHDMDVWIMEQVTGVCSSDSEDSIAPLGEDN